MQVRKITAIKDSSASSKSKAKTLSKGKKVTGVIAYGDSKADWYKIKLTKSAKLNLYYLENKQPETNEKNGFKITFYNKDGKVFSGKNNGKKVSAISKVTRLYPGDGWYISLANGGTKFDLPSGTYYIKVERMRQSVIWFLYIKMDHILGKIKNSTARSYSGQCYFFSYRSRRPMTC